MRTKIFVEIILLPIKVIFANSLYLRVCNTPIDICLLSFNLYLKPVQFQVHFFRSFIFSIVLASLPDII